jgi:dTDP-4-amino-4,6-dideoxygalactose transaminase
MNYDQIPLFKVRVDPKVKDHVDRVLGSGHIAQGPLVDKFEEKLAELLNVPPELLVTVNSGTSALHLAYHLAGISPGDPVVATPMTCAATITPLVHFGAEIIWADVDQATGNIDARDVRSIINDSSPPVRAVVTVDWAGTPAWEDPRFAVPGYIPIIQDAAHAMLALRRNGRSIASYAPNENLFVAFSLQAIKHLTTGDGGVLVCPSIEIAERARLLRWFGLDRRSKIDARFEQDITEAGYKMHMNDIAAAIGIANLHMLPKAVQIHRANAAYYHAAFGDLAPYVMVPTWHPGSSYWVYTILVENRASFQAHMTERGIVTSQVHRRCDTHPAFAAGFERSLPGLDYFSEHQVSIPCGWWVGPKDVDRVIDAVKSWVIKN